VDIEINLESNIEFGETSKRTGPHREAMRLSAETRPTAYESDLPIGEAEFAIQAV